MWDRGKVIVIWDWKKWFHLSHFLPSPLPVPGEVDARSASGEGFVASTGLVEAPSPRPSPPKTGGREKCHGRTGYTGFSPESTRATSLAHFVCSSLSASTE